MHNCCQRVSSSDVMCTGSARNRKSEPSLQYEVASLATAETRNDRSIFDAVALGYHWRAYAEAME